MCVLACGAYTVFKMCVQTIATASCEVIVSFLRISDPKLEFRSFVRSFISFCSLAAA